MLRMSINGGAACSSEMQLPFQCLTSREALERAVINSKTAVTKSMEKVSGRK
jgi:hypothetical protein